MYKTIQGKANILTRRGEAPCKERQKTDRQLPKILHPNRIGQYDVAAFVDELFEALEPEDFYKTEELRVLPGVWADVYRPVLFIDPESGESNDWYIKFFIENDAVRLHIMSANYDGCIH